MGRGVSVSKNVYRTFKMTALKLYIYILIGAFAWTACDQNISTAHDKKLAVSTEIASYSSNTAHMDEIRKKTVNDSLVFLEDTLFVDLELVFNEISKNEFQLYKRKYQIQCVLDSGHFISGSGLYVSHHCKEICETYLAERTTNRKMLMPSSYDAGVLTMFLSPTCHQLIICSSYDGPDYGNYYEHRAEIFVFTIKSGIGLQGIKPAFKYYSKDWSIEDLTCVNEKTIALKIYDETRCGDGTGVKYKYLKADLYQ